ncbi:hypothetical protein FI667_g12208, partial [Globisporangium splendens]
MPLQRYALYEHNDNEEDASPSPGSSYAVAPLMPAAVVQKPKAPRRPRKDNSARAKRYRAKKKTQLELTLKQVATLRAHVRELSTLKQIYMEKSLHTSYTSTGSPLRLVHEYFEVFRYGMQLPPGRRRELNGETQTRVISSQRQEQFLEAMVRPDCQFGDVIGTAHVVEQWKRYSTFYSSLFLEFVSFRMHAVANCSIVTTSGVLHMRFARRTIESLFPHVLSNEALVQMLLGRELHLKYTDHFYFDDEGKVEKYELTPEMIEALYEIVGNLEDVTLLLGGALIEDRAVILKETTDDDVVLLYEENEGAVNERVEQMHEKTVEMEEDQTDTTATTPSSSSTASSPQSMAMDLGFILS